jgi:hypothetical protein
MTKKLSHNAHLDLVDLRLGWKFPPLKWEPPAVEDHPQSLIGSFFRDLGVALRKRWIGSSVDQLKRFLTQFDKVFGRSSGIANSSDLNEKQPKHGGQR